MGLAALLVTDVLRAYACWQHPLGPNGEQAGLLRTFVGPLVFRWCCRSGRAKHTDLGPYVLEAGCFAQLPRTDAMHQPSMRLVVDTLVIRPPHASLAADLQSRPRT